MFKNKKTTLIFTLLLFLALIIMPFTFAEDNATEIIHQTTDENNIISENNHYNGTIYVSPNGNDDNNGSDDGNVKTIGKAIELASKNENSSHKIIIKEGNYTEYNLEIKSKIEISSQGNVIINGNNTGISNQKTRGVIFYIDTPEEVKISGITFKSGWGGAITITDAKVTIDSCIFTNNTSDYGGAIFWNADNGILSNSYFTLNRARIGSAVLWGTNDEDDIKNRGKNGLIINTTFDNNDNANTIAGGCMGLAIYADEVHVVNCNFTNNIGKFDTIGGSLLINGKYATIDGCIFKNNTMDQAPAIQVHGDFATIINSKFINNTVSNLGRAGAIDIQSNNIKVYNNTFTNNGGESCYNGGAITIYTFEDGIKNITKNYFINNSANYGGAIFINGGAESYVYDEKIIVDNNIFDGNTAKSTAAGIYILNVTIDESIVIIRNNQFKNLKSIYSSAIHITSAEVEIANNTIVNCISLDGNNHIFNTDGYIDGNLTISVNNGETIGLFAGKTIDVNATVVDDMNNYISGGTVYFTVNGNEVGENGFSLESGVATVPFYSTVDGVYLISANYYNGEITTINNCTIVAVPYIITIYFNDTQGICNEKITIPVEVSVIIIDTEYIANDENLTITFNNENFNVELINGSADINLTLPETNGTYRLDVTYDIKTVSKDIIVKDNVVSLIVPEIKVTPHSGELNITLKDAFGNPMKDSITLIINGSSQTVKTDEDGMASVKLNLTVGNYNVSAIYTNPKYKTAIVNSTIAVDYIKTTLTAQDIDMVYNDGTSYIVRLADDKNRPIANQTVNISLNGKTTPYTTDANGIVTLLITLSPNKYSLSATYDGNEIYKKSSITNTVKVISKAKLTGSDVNMYYSDNKYYKVRLYDDDGKVAGAGKIIKITVNGKTSEVKTDKNGYASLKISLNPKTYTVTAKYNHLKISNKIVVKQILKAKNISKKKSKTVKFKVTLKKGKKALKNKKIKFKIKGKTYTKKTNKKGIATVSLKNLKVGKHTIYSSYGKLKIKNTIKIKKELSTSMLIIPSFFNQKTGHQKPSI